MDTALIIGGSSQLGLSLVDYLEACDQSYVKTTRKQSDSSVDLYLDLFKFDNNLNIPNSVKTAYFLAGVSDNQYCEMNKEYVHIVNVIKTLELIRYLNSQSVHTVFVSSASVFDGKKQKYSVDDAKNPRNFYGVCKSEVEDAILNENLNASIFRVGKIAKSLPVIRKWEYEISIGEKPTVYSNRYISPLSVEQFTEHLISLGKIAVSGVSQISANDEISYLELFNRLFPGCPSNVVYDGDSHELLIPSGLFNDFSPPSSWTAINCFD